LHHEEIHVLTATSMKITVLWDVVLCSMTMTNVSEVLAASIIRANTVFVSSCTDAKWSVVFVFLLVRQRGSSPKQLAAVFR
jgi:hypothetical protein